MTKTRVLIVDDEPNIRDLLATSLRFAGFDIQTAANGTSAVAAVTESEPDIILLDVMLPDMNGYSVTKKLRSAGIQAPILFLTARDEVEDKITGLTVGGDDYLTKPFSLDEVVARIQAILRRTKSSDAEPAVIDAGPVVINQDAHEVSVEGTLVDLSPTEYKLLRFLVMNADRVLTKAQILDHVWEYDFNGDMGIVESYVSYLRKKIDPISSRSLIQTKRGVGYIYKKND
jgi:two-component system OmpR family response regulator